MNFRNYTLARIHAVAMLAGFGYTALNVYGFDFRRQYKRAPRVILS